MTPTACVLVTAGTNCDAELAEAFALAGAQPERVLLGDLLRDPARLERYHLIGLPGGFSYGDAIAAGRVQAVLIRRRLFGALRSAVDRGVPVIAPCNGFQVAVQIGLLPGPLPEEAPAAALSLGASPADAAPPAPSLALAGNAGGAFVDRWVRVEYPAGDRCVWTRGLGDDAAELRLLPIAHAEGRFVSSSPELLQSLERAGMVAVRYAEDDDPNGSEGRVAGICDASGLVLGLMPHPERYLHWFQHPFFTRLDGRPGGATPPGLRMFEQAVEAARAVPVG